MILPIPDFETWRQGVQAIREVVANGNAYRARVVGYKPTFRRHKIWRAMYDMEDIDGWHFGIGCGSWRKTEAEAERDAHAWLDVKAVDLPDCPDKVLVDMLSDRMTVNQARVAVGNASVRGGDVPYSKMRKLMPSWADFDAMMAEDVRLGVEPGTMWMLNDGTFAKLDK